MTVELPEMPDRIAVLPRDHRGFPVPWFVQWFKDDKPVIAGIGEPDFRVIDVLKFRRALQRPYCWICGEQMGQHRVFTIGPMCSINRVISEPPSHRACAEFSVKACPFLSRPRMRRNEVDLPESTQGAAGFHIDRNPGAICLWETRDYKAFRVEAGNAGVLFRLGDPVRVDWWAHGRAATRAEVLASIESGLPELEKVAREHDGPEGVKELKELRKRIDALLPPETVEAT